MTQLTFDDSTVSIAALRAGVTHIIVEMWGGGIIDCADKSSAVKGGVCPKGGYDHNPSTDIAKLRGKRFVAVPKTKENERVNTALEKAFSAGDNISARFLVSERYDIYFSTAISVETPTTNPPSAARPRKRAYPCLKFAEF